MPGILVNLDVDDLERAEVFYRDGLGLSAARRLGADIVEMQGAEVPIYLLRKPAGSAAHAGGGTRSYRRHWTPVHVDFVVEDIDAAVRRALAAGALAEGPVRVAEWGKLAAMADPFGHGFCLVEFTGRGYDAIAVR